MWHFRSWVCSIEQNWKKFQSFSIYILLRWLGFFQQVVLFCFVFLPRGTCGCYISLVFLCLKMFIALYLKYDLARYNILGLHFFSLEHCRDYFKAFWLSILPASDGVYFSLLLASDLTFSNLTRICHAFDYLTFVCVCVCKVCGFSVLFYLKKFLFHLIWLYFFFFSNFNSSAVNMLY